MLASQVALPDCGTDCEVVRERLVHRGNVALRDRRRDERQVEVVDQEGRGSARRLDVEGQALIAEDEVVGGAKPHPLTGGDGRVADDRVERRRGPEAPLQADANL